MIRNKDETTCRHGQYAHLWKKVSTQQSTKEQQSIKTITSKAIIDESLELLQEVDKRKTMTVDRNKGRNDNRNNKEINNKMAHIITAIINGVEIVKELEKNINESSTYNTTIVAKVSKNTEDK